uniref:Acid ceramidase N-terminal domain-containing protein n=1 Tax=Lotharella globosa TaxID=91324 RepID=A0A7S3ZDY4_9EUKA
MGNITGPSYRVNSTFKIDLDRDPRDRWTEAVEAKKEFLQATLEDVISELPASVQKLIPFVEWMLDDAEGFLPEPYREEVKGIAEVAGVPPGQVLIANIYYELASGCTGLVAIDPEKKTAIHARNLDYGLPGLQNLTVNVEFFRNGSIVAKGTTYVGYVGLLTGASPMGFSVQLNERDTKNGSVWDNAFEALFKGGAISGFLLRDLLVSGMSFSEAIQVAQTRHIISPCYYIFAGPGNEAAVVTRERQSAVDTMYMSDTRNENVWFLLQTNYDHWEKPPADDTRRNYTAAHMRDLGQGAVSVQSVFDLVSAWPTQNAETTSVSATNPHVHVHAR